MKKHLLAAAISAVVLSGCGKETVIKEVLVTAAPAVTETTSAPQQVVATKFDLYLEDVYEFSAQAREWAESDLLEFGTIVCDSFRQGNSLDDIIGVMSNHSSGAYDNELYAAVILSSVANLCPEYEYLVNAQS